MSSKADSREFERHLVEIHEEQGVEVTLTEYQLRAVTGGKDAQGEVTVEVTHEGRKFRARGVSTDIVQASGRAYVAAINRALTAKNGRTKPAHP